MLKLISELASRDRNNNWKELTKNLTNNPKKFWRITKSLRDKNTNVPSTIIANDQKLSTNVDKAEALACVFEKAHQITLNQSSPYEAKVNNYMNKIRNRNSPNLQYKRAENTELIDIIR